MYEPGTLHIEEQKVISNHIASPEAVIDDARQEIVLFYHGQIRNGAEKEGQRAAAAVSIDGLHFNPLNQVVGPAYLRVFHHGDLWYSLDGSGEVGGTDDLHKPFRPSGNIIGGNRGVTLPEGPGRSAQAGQRTRSIFYPGHIGVDTQGDRLAIYFTCVGQMPEHIMATVVDMAGPVTSWKAKGTQDVLQPALEWEGAGVAAAHSVGGKSHQLENSLRDPAVFRDNGQPWLVYAAAGEHGMGIVRIEYEENH